MSAANEIDEMCEEAARDLLYFEYIIGALEYDEKDIQRYALKDELLSASICLVDYLVDDVGMDVFAYTSQGGKMVDFDKKEIHGLLKGLIFNPIESIRYRRYLTAGPRMRHGIAHPDRILDLFK